MKTILLSIFFLSSVVCYSQSSVPEEYTGMLTELYLYRQPSARAEAMGTGLVASNTADFGSNYNPALTALNKDINFNFSSSTPYYYAKNSSFKYFGGTYSNKKIGSLSISYYTWGNDEQLYSNEIEESDKTLHISYGGGAQSSVTTLNYSNEIIKDFFAGINLNWVHFSFGSSSLTLGIDRGTGKGNSLSVDIGVLKRFRITDSDKIFQSIQLGAAIINLPNAEITYRYYYKTTELVPQIFRIGGSYDFKIKRKKNSSGNIIESFTHIEYQDVFNSNGDISYKTGEEITIMDMLILRAGYYHYIQRKITDFFGVPEKGTPGKFTYGAGLKLPLNLIFNGKNLPAIQIDYVNLPQHNYGSSYDKWENFNSFSINLNFQP